MPMPLFPVPPPLKRSDTGDYAGGMISGQRTEIPLPIDGKVTVTTEDGSGWSGAVSEVDNVDTITFDSNLFQIFDLGGGQVGVGLNTTTCSPPP